MEFGEGKCDTKFVTLGSVLSKDAEYAWRKQASCSLK